MIQLVICDDNPLHAAHTRELAEQALASTAHETDMFSSAEQLLKVCECGDFTPDIAILDIEMGGMNGINLAARLNESFPRCAVIYTTSYLDYAQEVYSTNHIWYVVKKDAEKHMPAAIEKALRYCSGVQCRPSLLLKNRCSTVSVAVDDVIYIERALRKTKVFTAKNGDYEVTATPEELLKDLAPETFIRCHQSFRVNPLHIKELDHSIFIMDDGTQIPISRTYNAEARSAFLHR